MSLVLFSSNFGNLVFDLILGDEVKKILRNSLFIFHFVLPVLPCKRKKIVQKITQVTKKPKTKLPKYVMSWAKVQMLF